VAKKPKTSQRTRRQSDKPVKLSLIESTISEHKHLSSADIQCRINALQSESNNAQEDLTRLLASVTNRRRQITNNEAVRKGLETILGSRG